MFSRSPPRAGVFEIPCATIVLSAASSAGLNRFNHHFHSDAQGVITFANDDFVAISGFSHDELIGQPLINLVRHPDMPAEAFRDLWATLQNRRPGRGSSRIVAGTEITIGRASITAKPEGGCVSVRTAPTRDEVMAKERSTSRFATTRPGACMRASSSAWAWRACGDSVLARIDNARIGRRFLAIMIIVMILLAGAWRTVSAPAVRSKPAIVLTSGDVARQVAYYKLYAQGLQMGQALRNAMLDPANPKGFRELQPGLGRFRQCLACGRGSGCCRAEIRLAGTYPQLRSEQRASTIRSSS